MRCAGFLRRRFSSSLWGSASWAKKRFSLEGGEGVMVLLNRILQLCPSSNVKEIEMGMAHRGRLNILANFFAEKDSHPSL